MHPLIIKKEHIHLRRSLKFAQRRPHAWSWAQHSWMIKRWVSWDQDDAKSAADISMCYSTLFRGCTFEYQNVNICWTGFFFYFYQLGLVPHFFLALSFSQIYNVPIKNKWITLYLKVAAPSSPNFLGRCKKSKWK